MALGKERAEIGETHWEKASPETPVWGLSSLGCSPGHTMGTQRPGTAEVSTGMDRQSHGARTVMHHTQCSHASRRAGCNHCCHPTVPSLPREDGGMTPQLCPAAEASG